MMNRVQRLPDWLRFRSRQAAVLTALVTCLLLAPWVAEAQSNSAPVFTEGASATRSFNETIGDVAVETGSNIGAAVVATDTDASDTLTYALEGTDADRFGINSTSGQLRTQVGEKYDHEAKSSHSVTVRAEDSSVGSDTISESNTSNPTATLPVPQQQTATCTGAIEDNCDLTQDTDTTGVAVNSGGVLTTGNRYIYWVDGVEGWIKPMGDKDWYKIALEGGMNYRVTLFGLNAWGNLDWNDAVPNPKIYGIYNSSGVKMPNTTNRLGAGLDARVYFSPPNDGDYFISVGALGNGGLYRLIVQDVPVDPPANDTTSAVITAGISSFSETGRVFGEIDRYNDVDWYKLTMTAGRGYLIDMIGGGEYEGDIRDSLIVGVYDTDSNYIANTRNDNGRAHASNRDDARSYFTASSTGTYYIAVTANGNPYDVVADLGTYRLWVTEIDPDVPDSAHEMTTAVVTEATDYRGEVDFSQDRDWIRAELTEDVTYKFIIDEISDGHSTYNPKIFGIYRGSTNSRVPTDFGSRVEFTPDTTGTYYVEVGCNTYGFWYQTGGYIFRMKILSPDNQPAAGAPTIGGTAQVGKELTADTSSIADADGLTNVSYEYQWIASNGSSDVEIANATAPTYTVADDDVGWTIQVRVTFTDDADHQETLTSEATEAVDFAVQPQRANTPATGALTISGTAEVGTTLTAITSAIADADGLVNASFDYQWERQVLATGSVTDIPGATGASYKVTSDDRDSAVRVSVSFSDDAENSETLSSYWLLVLTPPNTPATGAPTISGTAQVGETLTADTSSIADADGLTNASFSYQWIASNGRSDVEIANATAPTYTVADDDEGWTIQVRVSFTDDAGTEGSLTSAATALVQPAAPDNPPDTPNQPKATAVFVGGVDLEWNEVPGADSYDVQQYRGGQWTDLPTDGVAIAFYGAGAIISGLDPEASLWFRVRAANGHGVSDWSAMLYMNSTSQFRSGRQARPGNEPASGAPAVHGTAQVGESLWADASGIEDGNGLDRVQFRYQWVSGDGNADTDIAGATDSGYTLVSADVGRTIKVRVAFTDRGGYSETRTGAATGAVAAAPNNPATGKPAISGTAQVGETLTVATSGIADADGLDNATFSYQWMAGGTEIPGATGPSYTLVSDDEGKTIQVWVGFIDDARNEEALASAATEAVGFAVQQRGASNTPATGQPTISGTAQVGEMLTADTSGIADVDGLVNATYSYQWLGDDTDIAGARSSTYTLVDDDEGRTIKVRVIVTDDEGNETTLTSTATDAVEAAAQPDSPATGQPTITGTVQVGEMLTAVTTGIADADGLVKATYSYQWVANDGITDTDISGATDATYTLAADDAGRTIKVRVIVTDDLGNETTLTSTATDEVGFAVQQQTTNTPATGEPTIIGTAQVGEMLTADTSGIADVDGLVNATYSYQWLGDDTDIAGATSSTYTLLAGDEGRTIKVRVIVTDDEGNETTLTSTATAAVAAPQPPAKPTGLSAAVVSHDAVTLTWDDPQDDSITGYVILRRDRAIHLVGTFVTITDDTGSTDTTYTDDTVEPDKEYVYRIKAINEHGEVSEESHWVRGFTPAVPVPDKPTGLSAAVSHDAVALTWDDPQDDSITGYVILRRDREIHLVGTFITITDDTGSTDTTYTDETVEPDKEYVYRIKAINEHGEVSEESHWVRGFTPAAPAPAG